MGSTFYSLGIARSALNASQVALDVTGQNIANVNTNDYTRQSADLVSVNYTAAKSRLADTNRIKIGQGVNVSRIAQMRDQFLDTRVRNANSQFSTLDTVLSGLSDLEGVLDETSTDGLHVMLNDFYARLQGLSNNVGNVEYATLVRSAAEKVVQTLNQYAFQFKQIREEQMSSFTITVDNLNTTIEKINEINAQIKDQTLRGGASNELLDMRNSYLDTLSGYLNITVTPQDDGTVKVTSDGSVDVLDSHFDIELDGERVTLQRTDGASVVSEFLPSNGVVRGYLELLNGAGTYATGDESTLRGLPYYERAFDNFAEAFAGTFNAINTLDPLAPAPLFTGFTAGEISISQEWYDDANFIVVADQSERDNITKMINAMDQPVDTDLYPGVTGTFESFSRTIMSDIAVDVDYYGDMDQMYGNIVTSIANQREAISGVSTDEEAINMIRFQRAYQAAARLMTVLDENLNTLINNMGLVGR